MLAKRCPSPISRTLNAALNAIAGVLLVIGFVSDQGNAHRRARRLHDRGLRDVGAVSHLVRHLPRTGRLEAVPGHRAAAHDLFLDPDSARRPGRRGAAAGASSRCGAAWRWTSRGTGKIAKITLPIWLFVSVTGVVVYLMLYRLGVAPSFDPHPPHFVKPASTLFRKVSSAERFAPLTFSSSVRHRPRAPEKPARFGLIPRHRLELGEVDQVLEQVLSRLDLDAGHRFYRGDGLPGVAQGVSRPVVSRVQPRQAAMHEGDPVSGLDILRDPAPPVFDAGRGFARSPRRLLWRGRVGSRR